MSRREDRSYLRIDESGQVIGLGSALQARLHDHAGIYGFVSGENGRLVFEQVENTPNQDEYNETVVLQGDIEAMGSTFEAINFVNSARQSGNLIFLSDGVRKTLYFQSGEVRGASSNRIEDRLGEIMYRFGALSRETLDKALEVSRRRRRPLGNYLLDEGIISQADLYRYVKRQVEEIFYSTLCIATGQFVLTRFKDEKLPSPISLNAQSLLMEGLRRMDEMAYFQQKIPDADTQLVQTRSGSKPPELKGKTKAVYDTLAQPCSVEHITHICRLGDFETLKVLFKLLNDEHIRVLDGSVDAAEDNQDSEIIGMVDTFNAVFHRIFQAISRHGRQDALEQGLETFLQFYGFVELFQNVKFDQRGQLDKIRLLENLRQNQADNRMGFLQQALNELLFFEMFAAREWLNRDEQHELQKIINQLFIDIG